MEEAGRVELRTEAAIYMYVSHLYRSSTQWQQAHPAPLQVLTLHDTTQLQCTVSMHSGTHFYRVLIVIQYSHDCMWSNVEHCDSTPLTVVTARLHNEPVKRAPCSERNVMIRTSSNPRHNHTHKPLT